MRFSALAALAIFAACIGAQNAHAQIGDSPFPVERGSAMPPPAEASTGQGAPPEGEAPGGIDFGQWRAADPAIYGPRFQAQVRERFAGQDDRQLRAGLEANGFACEDQANGRLHCRIEIMVQQCAVDWYAVRERSQPDLIAGFDRMCLGAQ